MCRALTAALDQALSLAPHDRQRMAVSARESVEARYSLAAMQAGTLEVYRELLERWR